MKFLKSTFTAFVADDCSTLAASLAYYTIFALPPLLYLLLTIVSWGMSLANDSGDADQEAEALIESYAGNLLGNESAADEIAKIMQHNQRQGGVWWKSLISLFGIIFGATGVVAAVQSSLNRVWRVQPNPDEGGIKRFFVKRLLSFAMILGLGFLLLVSLVFSAALTAIGSRVGETIGFEQTSVAIVNYIVMFLLTWIVFAALFRYMPDAEIGWKDVAVGSLVTSVLFSLGRWGMSLYFSTANPAAQLSSAAASLVVLLVWIYYSSMIFLYGAEFTKVWAERYGRGVRPQPGAVRYEQRVIKT